MELDSAKQAAVTVQDPQVVFCTGVMMIVLDKLDVRSLAVCRLVSTDWLTLASIDQLWERKREELWLGKAHIPRISKVPGLSKMESTSLSIVDGKRNEITMNDLCDHAWEFRFKEAAQYHWDLVGIYRSGPMRRYFHPNNCMTEVDGEVNPVWNVNRGRFFIFPKCRMREQRVCIIRWPDISALNVWPFLSVVRKPDWSWVLSDRLYCFSSIPDAHKVDGTGPHAA